MIDVRIVRRGRRTAVEKQTSCLPPTHTHFMPKSEVASALEASLQVHAAVQTTHDTLV